MDKKRLVLWSLYDFANSIAFIVFFLYYSQWLVVEAGLSDFWFNMTFVWSSVLLLAIAPVASVITDKLNVRIPGLRITTMLSVLAFFVTGLIASFFPERYVWSIVTFTLATFFYMFSFSYYHPLLQEVAEPEKRGIASGWGQFGNWTGQIAGLLMTLPLASGVVILFGKSVRAQTLIPAAVLFFVLTVPTLFFYKEKTLRKDVSVDILKEYKGIVGSFRELIRLDGVGRFFLAYFFFNDAIITASNNFPIYLEKVFGVSDQDKSILLICIIAASAIGAPLSGMISDKIGLKKTLWIMLVGWIIIFPSLALSGNFKIFFGVSLMMGFWFGAIWTVTRAYLLQLTPVDSLNQSFTYYTLLERFSTFVSPISWGLIVTLFPKTNGANYKVAVVSMAIFVFVGLLLARKLPDHEPEPVLIKSGV